jgi:HSP90 family molecular chaperone
LNVSRESLQSNRFLRQLRQIILKRIIQLFTKISEGDDQEKIDKMQKTYGSVLKLGAVEDVKNRDKLAGLTRYVTNQRNNTSFDQVSYSSLIFIIYTSANYSFLVPEKQKKRTEAGLQIKFTTSAGIDSALSRSSI